MNEARLRRIRPHWDFSANMALIAGVFAFGAHTIFAPVPSDSIPLRVAAVQANIPQEEKFDAARDQILERYTALTDTALAMRPQLLLWPEAATPGSLNQSQDMVAFVSSFARSGNTNFLLGTLEIGTDEHDYNIAALFTGFNPEPQIYRKMHLVPFGEYIPFRHSFPPFEWVIGDLVPGDFAAGKEYTVLQLHSPEMKAAALVCFEDTLGDLTRHFVQRGAQLLVNVTNDGWFQHSQGSEQHLANALFEPWKTDARSCVRRIPGSRHLLTRWDASPTRSVPMGTRSAKECFRTLFKSRQQRPAKLSTPVTANAFPKPAPRCSLVALGFLIRRRREP